MSNVDTYSLIHIKIYCYSIVHYIYGIVVVSVRIVWSRSVAYSPQTQTVLQYTTKAQTMTAINQNYAQVLDEFDDRLIITMNKKVLRQY